MSKLRRHLKRGAGPWIALAAVTLTVRAAPAATGPVAMEAGTASTTKLSFSGDFRVRHESLFNPGRVDRHRERFRLRFGAKAEMDKWELLARLASGTGEQTSTNQTFGNGWNQKGIYIDQAYATYKPLAAVRLSAGRMNNPFWRIYSSDLVWDTDVSPEGFAEQFEADLTETIGLFANLAQLPLYENSGSHADPWMMGSQIGVKTKLGGGLRWGMAVAHYNVSMEDQSVLLSTTAFSNDPAIDQPAIQGENTRVPGTSQLAGQYEMLHLTSELGFQLGLPVRLQGDFVRNVDAKRPDGRDTGYQLGAILGSARNAREWEAGYFFKYLEANATLSDFTDSDFGPGGTNRKGHIMWLAYGLNDFVTLQTKYYITRHLTGAASDINRFQFDTVVEF